MNKEKQKEVKRCINPLCNRIITGESTLGLCKRCSSNGINTFGALAIFSLGFVAKKFIFRK